MKKQEKTSCSDKRGYSVGTEVIFFNTDLLR